MPSDVCHKHHSSVLFCLFSFILFCSSVLLPVSLIDYPPQERCFIYTDSVCMAGSKCYQGSQIDQWLSGIERRREGKMLIFTKAEEWLQLKKKKKSLKGWESSGFHTWLFYIELCISNYSLNSYSSIIVIWNVFKHNCSLLITKYGEKK